MRCCYMNSGILPKPTTADDSQIANISTPINVRDDVVRIDHSFNDKWTILGHYMRRHGEPGIRPAVFGMARRQL